MTNKLTSLALVLRRCETHGRIAGVIKPEEITLARQCVEAVIGVRPALDEVLRILEAPCNTN
jgi:hypothetical protein